MWVKMYLGTCDGRPKWANVADALLARGPTAATRSAPPGTRINSFLQTWETSLHISNPLPVALRQMIRSAKKFNVRLDPLLPDENLCLAVPIWYHLATNQRRSVANTAAGKCLRERHKVTSVGDCAAVAQRLRAALNASAPHTLNAWCKCTSCVCDREEKGCANPHRCAKAAYKAVDQLRPLWKVGEGRLEDNLSLSRSRKEANVRARAENGAIVFDPSIRSSLPIEAVFRVFDASRDADCAIPRRPPRPFAVNAESITVYTDGSCENNGCDNSLAGAGIWYGVDDVRNAAIRVPGERVTNQAAEMYAVAWAVSSAPPFAPMNIISD
ncbi:hypothetical protein C2E23DRAFT_701387, partial [Lenzites betulinus]